MAIFDEQIEIRERCRGVHCVDLGESFPTSIYLQNSASIQPRTSPSKVGGKYSTLFNRVLRPVVGGGRRGPRHARPERGCRRGSVGDPGARRRVYLADGGLPALHGGPAALHARVERRRDLHGPHPRGRLVQVPLGGAAE